MTGTPTALPVTSPPWHLVLTAAYKLNTGESRLLQTEQKTKQRLVVKSQPLPTEQHNLHRRASLITSDRAMPTPYSRHARVHHGSMQSPGAVPLQGVTVVVLSPGREPWINTDPPLSTTGTPRLLIDANEEGRCEWFPYPLLSASKRGGQVSEGFRARRLEIQENLAWSHGAWHQLKGWWGCLQKWARALCLRHLSLGLLYRRPRVPFTHLSPPSYLPDPIPDPRYTWTLR